jgi:membrane associated rhomboid family serine protease
LLPLWDSEPRASRPYLTQALIALNAAVFGYELWLDEFSLSHLLAGWGVVPRHFAPHTLVSSMFLHGGWTHLISNLWFLWVFGDNIEDTLGRARYLVFYLACGITGGLAHVVLNPASILPAIGASGAISGVMGAYLILFPRSRITTLVPLFLFATTIDVPALLMIGYWFVVQIFSGIGDFTQASASSGGTAWFAHIGGFLAGIVLIQWMPRRPRWRTRQEYRWR